MKNKIIIAFIVIVLGALIVLVVINNRKFYLEDKYYNNNELIEINYEKLKSLIDDKESFGAFIYEDMCVSANDFGEVLYAFQEDHDITFYMISYSEIKDHLTEIKFYPSFVIYKKGRIIDFLEADKDSDTSYFQNPEDFNEWFSNYVKLK